MKSVLIFLAYFSLVFTTTARAEEKEWTFLLFLNGNNNLDQYGLLNMNQMETVGSTDQFNMVVQWASLKNGDVRRVLVQKDENPYVVTSPVIENMGKVDMGDHRNLEAFIDWGIARYPAKKYFVAVWNHGSGWHQLLRSRRGEFHVNDISWDDLTGHAITTKELGRVMKNVSGKLGRRIDIYGSDACLMGMVEIAGEMDGGVEYFAGSQELEPGAGWPYDKVLARVTANPEMSPRDLSVVLTEEYVKSYQNGSNGNAEVTFSVYDMKKYHGFARSISALGARLKTGSADELAKVKAAAISSQSFFYSDYGDVGDFIRLLREQNLRLSVDALEEVNLALAEFVVINRTTQEYAKATGVSIWLPKNINTFNAFLDRYKDLAFDKENSWSDGVSAYLR